MALEAAGMNNQTTAMTGLVGVGLQPPLGPLTAIMPAMQGEFIWTGTDYIGEPTPWHSKFDSCESSYFGIVDTAGLQRMIFTFAKSMNRLRASFIGTGTIQN